MPTTCNTKAKKDGSEKRLSGNQNSTNQQRPARRADRPAKRWEDDLNDFVKDETSEATQSNDLNNDTTWLAAAKKTRTTGKERKTHTLNTLSMTEVYVPRTRRQQQHHDVIQTQSSSSNSNVVRVVVVRRVTGGIHTSDGRRSTPYAVCRTPGQLTR